MITAQILSRIKAANNLCKARTDVLEIRNNVCFNDKERENIDNIVLSIDAIVNRMMEVGK